jgi:hypothetical protein
MLEPAGYREHGRKVLTVADALAELVHDAWTYPDPEFFDWVSGRRRGAGNSGLQVCSNPGHLVGEYDANERCSRKRQGWGEADSRAWNVDCLASCEKSGEPRGKR